LRNFSCLRDVASSLSMFRYFFFISDRVIIVVSRRMSYCDDEGIWSPTRPPRRHLLPTPPPPRRPHYPDTPAPPNHLRLFVCLLCVGLAFLAQTPSHQQRPPDDPDNPASAPPPPPGSPTRSHQRPRAPDRPLFCCWVLI